MPRPIEAFLRFTLDKSSVNQTKQGLLSVEQALQKVRDKAEQVESQMDEVRNWSGYFGDLSQSALFFGAALSGPVVASAIAFVGQAGMADRASRKWLSATDDLQSSFHRIGRVSVEALLPFLEQAADIMEGIAGFVEEHPQAVQAALIAGTSLVGLAAVGEAVERGIRVYTDAKSLWATSQQVLAGKLMQQAANKQLAAATKGAAGGLLGKGAAGGAAGAGGLTAGGIGIAATLGLLAGGGINELLARYLPESGAQTFGKFATVGAHFAGGLFSDETAQQWATKMAVAFGEIPDPAERATEKVMEATESLHGLAASPAAGVILDTYIAWQKEQASATEEYERNRSGIIEEYGERRVELEQGFAERRADIVEDFGARQAEAEQNFKEQQLEALADFRKREERIEQDYNRNRQKIIRDGARAAAAARRRFNQQVSDLMSNSAEQEAEAEADYYDRRRQASENYNQEVQQAEADHQKQMLRARQDHDMRLQDAVRNQDAIAFLNEQRSYETSRSRSEEDYQDQARQRDENHARQMAEMERDFAEQREERQQDREERLSELQQQFKEERAQREADQAERLNEMARQRELERKQREEDFAERQTEAEEDFAERQAKETEQHQERLADMDTNHQEEMSKFDQQHGERLNDLDQQFQGETARREQAFKDQVSDLDAALLGEQELRNQYYEQMQSDLEGWLQRQQQAFQSAADSIASPDVSTGGGNGNGMALGGYAGSGLYRMGEQGREFVLNAATTQQAERFLGGSLSQSGLLSGLGARGGVGGQSVTNRNANLEMTNHFTDRDDQQMIISQVMQQVQDLMFRTDRGY